VWKKEKANLKNKIKVIHGTKERVGFWVWRFFP
jgi:hypothetical protein